MSATITSQLGATERLELLRALDRFRPWPSLDEKRYCLGCRRVICGNEIDITVDDDGSAHAKCPTPGCASIPMDWALPPNPRTDDDVDLA